MAKGEKDLGEFRTDLLSSSVHQFDCPQIVWLLEGMYSTELSKASTLLQKVVYIDADEDIGLGQCAFGFLELLDVLILGTCHVCNLSFIIFVQVSQFGCSDKERMDHCLDGYSEG